MVLKNPVAQGAQGFEKPQVRGAMVLKNSVKWGA
jgi:hypothetical protein